MKLAAVQRMAGVWPCGVCVTTCCSTKEVSSSAVDGRCVAVLWMCCYILFNMKKLAGVQRTVGVWPWCWCVAICSTWKKLAPVQRMAGVWPCWVCVAAFCSTKEMSSSALDGWCVAMLGMLLYVQHEEVSTSAKDGWCVAMLWVLFNMKKLAAAQ